MNKHKAHILSSWLLLFLFTVGQIVVYAHQHHSTYKTITVSSHHSDTDQSVQEKCSLCDQMHHAPIYHVQTPDYAILLTSVIRIYIPVQHHHKANALVHADGLSPPAKV